MASPTKPKAGRTNLAGRGRRPREFVRFGIEYKHKLDVIEYLLACGSMSQTLNQFYPHLVDVKKGSNMKTDAESKRVEFAALVKSLEIKYGACRIVNADQTGVCYEYLPRQTLDGTGTKTVWIKCAGKTKDRVTVMLLGDSRGTKYDPFIVFKRKDATSSPVRAENEVERHGFGKTMWKSLAPLEGKHTVQIHGNATAWWNSKLSEAFIEFHFANRADIDQKVLLLWDDFSGHWTEEAKAAAARWNVELVKVPPKYTYVCQPADISWNKPFKDALRGAWLASLRQQVRDHHPSKPFQLKPPSRTELVEWIASAWKGLKPTTIISGFVRAGLVDDVNAVEESSSVKATTVDTTTWEALRSLRACEKLSDDNIDNDEGDSDADNMEEPECDMEEE
ncbi:hypothetical protein P43SY_010988 [Pythium insidiosum]|uniref:DDE-1 domain-containing protein n=1 Tax=Pythium insidiosum TaxID=114742 RepID=A0AAD5LR60_PYTIN|nr:hypothetical protein P43SY_010988 [Pythium insidiosum]